MPRRKRGHQWAKKAKLPRLEERKDWNWTWIISGANVSIVVGDDSETKIDMQVKEEPFVIPLIKTFGSAEGGEVNEKDGLDGGDHAESEGTNVRQNEECAQVKTEDEIDEVLEKCSGGEVYESGGQFKVKKEEVEFEWSVDR